MNWDALGAIGEIAGALGVIFTLAYLARQIHESNKTARNAATQEIQNQLADWIFHINSTKEMVDLWLRGNLQDIKLDHIEIIQFRGIVAQLFNIWERAFVLKKEGRMDESSWHTIVLSRKNLLASPGIKAYWRDRIDHYNEDFCAVINSEMENANDQWHPLGLDLRSFELGFEQQD